MANANPANAHGKSVGGINWNNPDYEALVKQAAIEPDAAKRVELYSQAEDLLVKKEAAIAPIYWYTNLNMTKPYVVHPRAVEHQAIL